MAPDPVLTEASWRLLATVGIGRVALSCGALPVVLVVRCEVDEGRLLLHSNDPSLTRAAHAGDVVAFQVDDVSSRGAGSSVVVTGCLAPERESVVSLSPTLATRTELSLGPPVRGSRVRGPRVAS